MISSPEDWSERIYLSSIPIVRHPCEATSLRYCSRHSFLNDLDGTLVVFSFGLLLYILWT
ncbi:uncharacterized protein BT62DRAFT_443172 [Guyanagaster necrorhizus]|uniref:Uncharacterized protein n=1 Tax=Guyanagaster necrorhizus TaxID=856835 RepID=A0A9P7VKB1_9AGAR|nr:uncharacterized protein BT62DRAFT_443172 [Guyanagaster necrorhizus MCA 3950]KAG7442284.1 hypothetical protein BT62DRAFT_443172 [Guyanagaster necrorhizus MCA 3950]